MLRLQSRSFSFLFGSAAATCLLVWVSGCSSDSAGSDNKGSGAASSTGGSSSAGTNAGPGKAGSSPGSAGSGVVGTSGSATVGGTTDGACGLTQERIRITEVDVGGSVVNDEDEAALNPLSISPIPSGGSRVGWMGSDGKVHVTNLDASDQVTGAAVALLAADFQDIYADETGGVVLVTRDAEGGGTLNCGEPTNLCGTPPSPPVPCYDMYLVRFDGTTETWATKLTESSAALPPYSTGKTGKNVVMIWWYAHHGQIAFDDRRRRDQESGTKCQQMRRPTPRDVHRDLTCADPTEAVRSRGRRSLSEGTTSLRPV